MHNRLHTHLSTRPGTNGSSIRPAAVAQPLTPEPISDGALQRTSRRLAAHPALAIGAAFAVGLLIGKWVKR